MVRRFLAIGLAALVVVLLIVAITVQPRQGAPVIAHPERPGAYSVAVIGDAPYGEAQLAAFGGRINALNAADVALAAHLGDIKDSNTPCTAAYYQRIRRDFDRLTVPLVYTPGDNEWTDCHKPANGSYNPLERLAKLREVFFQTPNTQLAANTEDFYSYAGDGYPENVHFSLKGVTFGAMHVVGANNGIDPWTGKPAATADQTASVKARTDAAITDLRDTFAAAVDRGDRAVVIMTQADMFTPNKALQTPRYRAAYVPIVSEIVDQMEATGLPVYLFNGDTHVFREDTPLAADSEWPKFYGVTPTDDLQRVTVDGDQAATDYLKVDINIDAAEPVSWTRVPFKK